MHLIFFLPIRTGTLERERKRVQRKHDRHLSRVNWIDREIATLQQQRNEHFAAASAYADAFTVIDAQDNALQIDLQAAE